MVALLQQNQQQLVAEPSPAGGVAVRPAGQNEPGESLVRAVRLDKELENSPALEELSLSVVHVDVGGRVHRALGGLVRLLRRDRPFIVCSFTPEAINSAMTLRRRCGSSGLGATSWFRSGGTTLSPRRNSSRPSRWPRQAR